MIRSYEIGVLFTPPTRKVRFNTCLIFFIELYRNAMFPLLSSGEGEGIRGGCRLNYWFSIRSDGCRYVHTHIGMFIGLFLYIGCKSTRIISVVRQFRFQRICICVAVELLILLICWGIYKYPKAYREDLLGAVYSPFPTKCPLVLFFFENILSFIVIIVRINIDNSIFWYLVVSKFTILSWEWSQLVTSNQNSFHTIFIISI